LHWPLLQAAIENDSIYCPKHGYAFNLLTGSPVNSVAMNCKPLKTFRIAYEGSTLGIDI
jgi:nitrite reductase/ring-hydroxylating ferredoxin subunit